MTYAADIRYAGGDWAPLYDTGRGIMETALAMCKARGVSGEVHQDGAVVALCHRCATAQSGWTIYQVGEGLK